MIDLFPQLRSQGLDYVDVGCSGQIDARWHAAISLLNYIGFDPNEVECRRLSMLPSRYKTTRYIPYAVGGETGPALLHLTQSEFCNSLLRPRQNWLSRFSFHDLFIEKGTTQVNCVTLDHLASSENLRADILKLDTQGLELPILKTSPRILSESICVETETGFVENYHGETVMAEVDDFMRRRGFLLFDMVIHRVDRANQLGRYSRQQPLWCECLWLRDYLAERSWGLPTAIPNRLQVVKALYLCKVLGVYDYGFELAGYFHALGLLSEGELARLSSERIWLEGHSRFQNPLRRLSRLILSGMRSRQL